MANLFLTPNLIAREALALLQSNLVAARLFSRRYESDLNAGSKVGDRIRIRRRSQGVVDEYNGVAITIRDIQETSIDLILEKHFDASIRITDRQRTLDLKDFSEQVLAPRIVEMGEKIDTYALTKLADLPNVVGVGENIVLQGTPGALPNSIGTFALVEKSLNDLKVPANPRVQVVSPKYKATLLGVTSFVEVEHAGDSDALRQARLNKLMGIDTFMGQNVPTASFTSGTQTAGVVNVGGGALKGATSIAYDGGAVAAGTLKVGDIVNIAGYGNVVVSTANTAVANAGILAIKEPLRSDVADNATFTVYDGGGNARTMQGAAFHPDAFAFVSVPLEKSMAAVFSENIPLPESGISLRATYDYDRDLKADVLSIDILVGAVMVDGRLGGQIIENV